MRFSLTLAAGLALYGAAASASAQNASTTLHVRALAATCANCHGTDGRSIEGAAVPSLAGLPKDYAAAQMRAFRDGTRPATVMHQLAKGFTDQQIDQLAAYFSTVKR